MGIILPAGVSRRRFRLVVAEEVVLDVGDRAQQVLADVAVTHAAGGVEVIVDQCVGRECSGRNRVFSPLPSTLRCGTPRRACRKSETFSLQSSSRRSAWKSSVDNMARSRLASESATTSAHTPTSLVTSQPTRRFASPTCWFAVTGR